ncbi:tetratricopeptide repeat protein [Flavobacterium sp.]|uniref:tetratricopeptide repeat protein n=1 Tax=Flavobacterium sp. TaxID=239 RepID=UPI003C6131CD
MKKIHVLLFVSICFQSVFAQKEGYWDKDRAFIKEINVSARDRNIIKIDDLPTGTTELIYRITLLDENQQMAGSLTSILKAIPDPTGISQGSAGAVFLMSKISGDDKCKYAIFTNKDNASKYQKTGKTNEACLVQDTPLSKDAKRLSIDKSSCLKYNSEALWFGFESTNWIMKQKIVVEIVPWVDSKLSRGWTLENRKFIINQCKTSALARKMTSSDDFCICLEEKIQKEYRFDEFQKLLTIEQAKIYKDNGNACYGETTVSKTVYADLRSAANTAVKKGDYGLAIKNYTTIINDNQGSILDYSNLGYCYLITKQYGKALKYLKEGEQKDSTELFVKLNLAHAYLLNDNYSAAKSIYKEYQTQNLTDSLSWTQKVKDDFTLFQKLGLPSADFDRVLKLFK